MFVKPRAVPPIFGWNMQTLLRRPPRHFASHMMTSSNGNISVLLALCTGNSPVTGEFPSQRPATRSFEVFFDAWINGWVNNGDAGDLRRHGAHYDVTVMYSGHPRHFASQLPESSRVPFQHTGTRGHFLWKKKLTEMISYLTNFAKLWNLTQINRTSLETLNRGPAGGGRIGYPTLLNTLRPRQNGRHCPGGIFKYIFLNEDIWRSIKISKFVPKAPISIIPSLVQIMAWRRPCGKPFSEPMMVGSPTHVCVTRLQWFKCYLSRNYIQKYLWFTWKISLNTFEDISNSI